MSAEGEGVGVKGVISVTSVVSATFSVKGIDM